MEFDNRELVLDLEGMLVNSIEDIQKSEIYKGEKVCINEIYEECRDNEDKFQITASYPFNEDFYYETMLKVVDFDKKREQMIREGNGFVIGKWQKIEKEIKSEDGIFSPRFGNTLSDLNLYMESWRCKCGLTYGNFKKHMICPYCNQEVIYRSDNYKMTGWLVLLDYKVITPAAYRMIASLCGKDTLDDILTYKGTVDEDGHAILPDQVRENESTAKKKRKKVNPFDGIGMSEFMKRFDEIIEYYKNINVSKKNKLETYETIMGIRDRVFTNSIPVYTTLLRPFELRNKKFTFEATNGIFNIMSKLTTRINNRKYKFNRINKKKQEYLYALQSKWMELDDEVTKILSGKKGKVRQLFSGRYTFTSRDVIIQNPSLRIDEVKLPYKALHELLKMRIINTLTMTYNMHPNEAYNVWFEGKIEPNPQIVRIIEALIKCTDRGLPLFINRNPTIQFGGMLQMFVVGLSDTISDNGRIIQKESVLEVPLQPLDVMGADFDGDVLNCYLITSLEFFKKAFQVFNPRNNLYFSPNDGMLNYDIMHQRDTVINLNAFVYLGRDYYTKEELDLIASYENYPSPDEIEQVA